MATHFEKMSYPILSSNWTLNGFIKELTVTKWKTSWYSKVEPTIISTKEYGGSHSLKICFYNKMPLNSCNTLVTLGHESIRMALLRML